MKKVLLTGATGYVGKRLISAISAKGCIVVCCTRDLSRFEKPKGIPEEYIDVVEVDFLKTETLSSIPLDIDGAYYLMHSMSTSSDYGKMEKQCAQNFVRAIQKTKCEHVVYLTGLANEDNLSKHLSSRLQVEKILSQASFHFTALRAGIIIGSGSASFEIIRDLVEKLPIMVTPKWLNVQCQPIAIADVLSFLIETLFNTKAYDQSFDIGCDDVLTYKEMLLGYARERGLQRRIYTLPVMTPKLSSYWLYFVTSTSYKLASSLVESMRVKVVCRPQSLTEIKKYSGIETISYSQSLKLAFSKIQAHEIASSWKDSFISSRKDNSLKQFMEVPTHGCFIDMRSAKYDDREECIHRFFSLGGENGWYAQSLWKLRGYLDQLWGGPGLRRGRRHPNKLHEGDALDFWRVLYEDEKEGKLILFAEMKLPGEAWLMFIIKGDKLLQKAVFRPKGIWGRLYWYFILPFHSIIFSGMLNRLAKGS